MSRSWTKSVGTALALLALSGCGSLGKISFRGSDAGDVSYPSVATTHYARALGYMDAGDDARAATAFEDLRARYPEYAGPLVNLAIIHGRSGRPDAAMAALERAIRICTRCAAANNELGIQQRRQGRFADAEKSYLRAIEADSGYALAYYNLGVLHDLYNGRPDLALRYYQIYTEHETDPESKALVEKWIADLKRRLGKSQRVARVGQPS